MFARRGGRTVEGVLRRSAGVGLPSVVPRPRCRPPHGGLSDPALSVGVRHHVPVARLSLLRAAPLLAPGWRHGLLGRLRPDRAEHRVPAGAADNAADRAASYRAAAAG